METLETLLTRLVLEYAQAIPATPLPPTLSLRRDLAIDSLSLVSLALRVGDELGVDLPSLGIELGGLQTVGDLFALARSLQTKGEERHEGNESRLARQ
jgi:acyl carrier protein